MNMQDEVNARILEENHILIISTPKDSITLDNVNVLDGEEIIATDVPEKAAMKFIEIWNGMLHRGERISDIRRIDIGWLTGVKTRKKYNA